MNSHTIIGILCALFGASFFSLKAVLVKLAYAVDGPLDPIVLLALRMGFALPVYLIIGWIVWRRRGAVPMLAVGYSFVLGLLGYYLCALLDFTGLQYITAQLERILLFTYPIFVVVIGALFFGGTITRWGVLAITLAYAGIGIIFAGGDITQAENLWLGTVLILATAFFFAMFQLFAKGLITQLGSWLFTCIAMSGAATGILVHFGIYAGAGEGVAAALDLPAQVIWIGIAIAFLSTIIPSFLVNLAIGRIGSQATSVLAMIGPITTIIAAILILGEPFGPVDALGTAVTILGIGLYTWFERSPQPSSAKPLKI